MMELENMDDAEIMKRNDAASATLTTADSKALKAGEIYANGLGIDDLPPEDPRMKFPVKVPNLVRQMLAETLGTFLLVLFGDGAIAQLKLMGSDFASVAFGYGLALMIGILASGGVSGGHLNPAVTIAMAAVRKCKWVQVPVYWAGQYLGAFLASAVLYGIYADGINALGGKSNASVGIFASYPMSWGNVQPSMTTLAFDQILGTALLLIIILSVTDGNNMKVESGLVPLLIGLGLSAIHFSFAGNSGCAINPARDFSPRLFTLIAGWDSTITFGDSTDYFFWIPWLLPHVGSILGAFLYQAMIEGHHPE